MRRKKSLCVVILALAWAGLSGRSLALDHVTLEREDKRIQAEGRLLVEAQDGGLLLLARDGVLWTVQPDELVDKRRDEIPFEPMGVEEMGRALLAELPDGFDCFQTTHYLICYNTSQAYTQWCGSLLERLYMAFTNFWSRKRIRLSEPEFPLVAIVFASKSAYLDYARGEFGEAAGSTIGYYSLRTNRMALYDLTGMAGQSDSKSHAGSPAQIRRMLARPELSAIVATVVHEATHQIAFNCGLHHRYSDCPMWFSEGIAIYFETPDLTSTRLWRSIGKVNQPRLARFRNYLRKRPADSLHTLISDNDRFRPPQALDAYAEAWALTYFLLTRHEQSYVEYLEALAQKKPMVWGDAESRLEEFKSAFGEDLGRLDREFVRYMTTRVR